MEKEELLSRLYTLRAGLSVVSQEKDQYASICDTAEKQKSLSQANADSDLNYYKQEINEAKKVKDAAQANLNRCTNNTVLTNEMRKYKKLAVLFAMLTVICTVAVALCVLAMVIDFSSQLGFTALNIVAYVAIGMIVCLIFAIKFGKGSKDYKEDIQKRTNEIPNAQARLRTATSDYEKAVAKLSEAEKQHNANIGKANNNFSLTKSQAEQHISAASAIIGALDKTYSDLVDYRDWGNIDYIIYCLETRRADNMKEALQLTDAEKRADRIVEAIDMANREICRTMTSSIAGLQNDMRKCFNVLSEQITQQTTTIMNNINSVKRSVTAQSTYLANLASEVTLNNALRAKANATSERLADDVEYIRRFELK